MTLTNDTSVARADGPQLAARWATAGYSSLLEAWPRMAEGLTRAALQTQDAVLSAGPRAIYAGLPLDARQGLAWVEAADQVQRVGLELWQLLAREGERMAEVTGTELRYRAVELLEQLDQAERQRQQIEQERDQLRQQAERERAQRRRAEQERDQERTRAKEERTARQRAERASARLERELERARERAQRAARPGGQQRSRPARAKSVED